MMYMGIELIQIVRCKDCKWYIEDELLGQKYHQCRHKNTANLINQDDFFCGYGEKRKDVTNE